MDTYVKVFYMDPKTKKIYRALVIPKKINNKYNLPKNCYSKGYIERIIDGINWKDKPYVTETIRKKINAK